MANPQSRFRVHKGRVIGPDMANVYSNAVQTVATQGHVNLDNFPSVTSGSSADTHGHVLQVLDIKNDSGADGRVYIGGQFVATTTNPATGVTENDYLWGAGQWDDSAGGDDYTDDSVDAKDVGADDFHLLPAAGAAANDGFVVHSTRQFSCIVVAIGATPQVNHVNTVQTYTYWNGSSWAALPLLNTAPLYSVANTDYSVIFGKPLDWALTTTTGPGEGVPVGRYAIRYQATNTVPGTVGIASRLFVGDVLRYPASLVPNGGALVANDIGWPISSQDEAPWAVLGVSAAAWEIAVGTERTPFAGTLGA